MIPWDATVADAFMGLTDPPEEAERKARLKVAMSEDGVVMGKRLIDVTDVDLSSALFDWYPGPRDNWGEYRDRMWLELTRMRAEAERAQRQKGALDGASASSSLLAVPVEPANTDPTAESSESGGSKRSQADRLVLLAKDRYILGISPEGDPYAVRRSGPNVAHLLRHTAGSLRSELAAEYHDEFDKTPSSSALADAMAALEGFARREVPTALHIRVARDEDASIWIDRGDPSGEAIHITIIGWSIQSAAPVVFRRTEATGIMPRPEVGGDLALLGTIINVTEPQLQIIIAWLVAALIPDIPHPPIAFRGIQGSGKSETQRILVRLLDPSPAPLRAAPRDLTDWVVAASGSWLVGLDNVSRIPEWLSDAMCRAVTGEGLIRRRLYSDSDLVVTSFHRVILFNGIEFGDVRGDLADRTLFLELPPISADRRRTEAELESLFLRSHPAILGGLLDLTVEVLGRLPDVQLSTMPRMGDFAEILAAVDAVTGWHTLAMFETSQTEQQRDVLEADEVATAVVTLMDGADGADGEWLGTATDLLEKITPENHSRKWPSTPQHLSGRLKRAVPALATAGILVDWDRGTDPRRRRLISIKRVGNDRPERPERPGVDDADGEDGEFPTSSLAED